MTMTDPISDMLTRIRNAMMAGRATTVVPYSKIKESITAILKDNGFIADYTIDEAGFKQIVITINSDAQAPRLTSLTRVSKPGRRVYAASKDIPLILSGRGMVIVSTSSGIMSGREARKRGLGGELICKVW